MSEIADHEHPTAVDPLRRLNEAAGWIASADSASVLAATVVLAVVVGLFHHSFLDRANLLSILQQSVYIGILAAGMSFLLAMRELDLSVGSNFGLSLIVSALLMQHGWTPWLAGLMAVLVGGSFGFVNALAVQVFRIPTIVATLATLSMGRGLALALTSGQQVVDLPAGSSFFTFLGGTTLGVATSVWVLAAVVVVLTVVLRTTPFGYRVRSIGSNPEAATFSGISVGVVRMQALVLIGLLAGLAGALGLAFFISGDPNIGSGFELQAIAAAVIGGTPLRGGSGTVFGAVVGTILLTVVANGLVFFDVPLNWSSFATGAVILLAVALDSLVRRRRRPVRQPGLDV
ncbi:MAG TPA: ABC transporter permease [Gaiellaceae bacterium]|nr:ABC transporter permease [Gaiellaceae bacterium]